MGVVQPTSLTHSHVTRNESDRLAGIEASVSEAGRVDVQHVESLSDA